MKKTITFFPTQAAKMLLATLLLTLTAQTARAAVYKIYTLEELREFMDAVHVEDFAGDDILLMADIDCEGGRFNTGDPEYPSTFRGTFDGQGYKIYNFVHGPTGSGQEGYGTAMFDFAETGAAIQNLTLEGTLEGTLPGTYSGAYSAAFVLAVESPLGLWLDNCHFNGSVTNNYHSAALVGFASSGTDTGGAPSITLKNCSANANITTTGNYIAGGLVAKGTGVKAYDCSFTGTISGKWTMGGLIGVAVNCTFEDCSFNGSMGEGPGTSTSTLSNGGCGGLVGYSDGSEFTRCTATVTINWDLNSGGTERTSSNNFVGEGGAAGVTLGASQFINCSATGKLTAAHGYAGGFVGWTNGAETFDHCTTDVKINADARHNNVVGNGGFAACVASDGATFVDCTTSSQGNDIYGGFYNVQHPKSDVTDVTVGANTFLRCTVNNVSVFGDGSNANTGGFCVSVWNGTFTDCTVHGGKPEAGFVLIAGKKPSSDYENGQTSTFTNCAVVGATVTTGFVGTTNPDNSSTNINKFKGCRASCTYYNLCNGSSYNGFAHTLRNKTTVEDCAAYGAQAGGSDELYGFAYEIGAGATVSRCVGAVLPLASTKYVAGFAGTISYDTAVKDCYSVYTARSACAESNINGTQGGFVRRATIGYNDFDLPIMRCFALGVVPAGSDAGESAGSFCGVTPYMSTDCFEDCYRPEESQVDDVGNGDADGVEALSAAEFANATAATMPNYDFADTWKAPMGTASSPYLAASTDANGDFWLFASVIGGKGHILINGEEPREAYPAGSVLTVEVVPEDEDILFTGWLGDGFADPTKRITTYTLKNVSAIAATFGTPIRTREQLAAIASNTSGIYILAADIDLAGEDWTPLCQDNNSPFTGMLYGDNHAIKNMTVNTNGNDNAGLFGCLGNATVSDITFENANVTGGNNAAALAGYANKATISGIVITGTSSFTGTNNVGGIVGYCSGNTLTNNLAVNVTVSYTYNSSYGGAIAGYRSEGTLTNNFYSDCTLNKTYSSTTATTGIGCNFADVTENNGAVGAIALYDQGTDNAKIISDNANESRNVALVGRTLYKDGAWNTLCLPFSLSAAQIAAHADFAGATLMTMDVTQKNGFNTENGTLYLWFKTATAIEAGVPYLVKWKKATGYEGNEASYDISNPVFQGVTISNSTAQAVESVTAGLETVQMVGTYSPVSVTADDKSILFLGDANTLYYSSTDRQIRSCRAYFSVPYIKNNAGAEARAFALSFDGEETTGISLTPGPSPLRATLLPSGGRKGEGSDYWYTIDGRKLSGKPSQRGMYINKGKKILVK